MTLTLTTTGNSLINLSAKPLINLSVSRAIVVAMAGSSSIIVTGETPTGLVNGSNATFTSLFTFSPESVEVFVSGVRLTLLSDYNTAGNNTISLFASPLLTELLRINYTRLI